MPSSNFRRSLLALLVTASFPVAASDFYVVVPVPNKTVSNNAINVALAGYTLPAGQPGTPYPGFNLKSLLAVTGDPGYTGSGVTWAVVGGSLPAGVTLNKDGSLSGTPTAPGTASFQVRASYKTKTGEQAYQIVVANLTVGLAASTPPQALVGQGYSFSLKPLLSVTGDSAYTGAGVTWSVVENTLPAGLYLTNDGFIAGTPTAAGSGRITVRASYKGINGEQTYQLVSSQLTVALASATPPDATVGTAYQYDLKPLLTVSGDQSFSGSDVIWDVSAGSLPAGLSLSGNGVISGIPTAASNSPFTVRATYKNAQGQQIYKIASLNLKVALATAAIPGGIAGDPYPGFDFKTVLSVTGDSGYTPEAASWSVVSGSLPNGLTLSNGVLSGTPSAATTTSFTLQAAYRNQTATENYSIKVDAAQVTGQLTAAPSADFGLVTLGNTVNRVFTFTNNGNTSATGVYASADSWLTIASTSCGTSDAKISMPKGASCTISVNYAPGSAGTNTGSVSVNWAGPTAGVSSLPVTGAGVVDFSSLMVGFTNDAVAITRNSAWASGMQWYWNVSGAQNGAPVGSVEFRRTVYVSGTAPLNAYLYGAFDNQLNSVTLNGAKIMGSYPDWGFRSGQSSPAFTLLPGTNVIAISVLNDGSYANPAGFALQVRNMDGSVRASEAGWKFK